jgi:type I restriction enzyme S subunit
MNEDRTKFGDYFKVKHGYAFKSEFFSDSGNYVVVTPGNFFDEGGFKKKGDKEKFYTGPVPDGFVLKRGDLIVAMTEQAEGLLGSSALIPEDNYYLHNQRLGLITDLDENKLDKKFLYYLFNFREVRNQIRATATGAKIRHTAPERILGVRFKYLSIKVQRFIAAILSAYDDLIENNSRRIQILEEMARRIYEEWFVRFRFPRHESVRMIENALGSIPDGWSVKTLDRVATINGLSIRRGKEPGHILYVDIASVSSGKIENVQELSFIEAPGRARRIVRHGDIIWSNVRPNRKSFALITNPPQNMIVSTGFTVISASSVPYSFLYHALTTEDFAGYLTNRAKGAAYPAVGSEDFANAKMIIPSTKLLSMFDEVAEPMQLEKNLLLKKNVILNCTRDLLLPKLISGEIDVSNFPEPLTD